MNHAAPLNRRRALRHFANGFGMLGLASLLADETRAEGSITLPTQADPLAPRPPMYPSRAKRVIFLFMSGGPSHVDTFDPKPRLITDNGKPLPFAMPHLGAGQDGELAAIPRSSSRSMGRLGSRSASCFPRSPSGSTTSA